MAQNVADVLLKVLAEAGATHIFGMPGDAINQVIEAVRQQDRLKFIQVRHEEAGAFAASAQSKLSGQLGVCVGTAGPGAIHLLNGLYDAKHDHAPVLAITGHVETEFIGTDYHQEIDSYSLFKDVSVFNQVVMTPSQIPHLAVQACQAAMSNRGIAHLSIPVDVAGQTVVNADRRTPVFRQRAEILPCSSELDAAAEVLNKAQRVVMLVGIGCLGAEDILFDVADKLAAPIIRTLKAKEIVPDDHPHCVGGLGLLGNRSAVDAIMDCDALLMVGTDFPYHDFYPKSVEAIQIDIDETRLGKRFPVSVGLRGHAGPTLEALRDCLSSKTDRGYLEKSRGAMKSWLQSSEGEETSTDIPIRPQSVARLIGDLAKDDAIFICDTGAVTVWAARHLHVRRGQRFTLSSSLASMGFGLPGALGAQLIYPDRQVIALCGDGGFGIMMQDFVTAVKYALPVKIVVFNNSKLGLIKMEQEAEGLPEYQTDLLNPDFAAFAKACGGHGITVSEPSGLSDALQTALGMPKPVIVDVMVNPDEITMPPKVSVGRALNYGIAKVRERLA